MVQERIKKKSKGGEKRRRDPFAALKQTMHPKARWEYLDGDYYDKLSDEEKTFMSKFIDEFYGASLTPMEEIEKQPKDFHSSKKLRKDCTDRNNARNRDLYAQGRTRGFIAPVGNVSDVSDEVQPISQHEDAVIKLLDMKDSIQKAALKKSKKST